MHGSARFVRDQKKKLSSGRSVAHKTRLEKIQRQIKKQIESRIVLAGLLLPRSQMKRARISVAKKPTK
jgi:hypothetical protein